MPKKKPSPLKGWRTLLFNLLGMASIVATSDFASIIPSEAMPYIGVGITVGNLILRLNTDTAVGQKTNTSLED